MLVLSTNIKMDMLLDLFFWVWAENRDETCQQSDDSSSNVTEGIEQEKGTHGWKTKSCNRDKADIEHRTVDENLKSETTKGEDEENTDSPNAKRRRRSVPAAAMCKESGYSMGGKETVSWAHLPQAMALAAAGRELIDRPLSGGRWLWKGGWPNPDFDNHVTQGFPLPHMATFTQKHSEK